MFHYTYGGKKGTTFQLVEAQELVVIRTTEALPLEALPLSSESRNLIPNLMPVAAFPEANVTVFRCMSVDERTPMQVRNAVRKTLPNDKSIRFAGRVLKEPNTGGIVVYTGNLYVQFKADTAKSECRKIIKSFGLKVKEDLGITARSYFVEADGETGSGIFSLSQKMLKNKAVECCHPELVRERKFKSVSAHPMQWHLREATVNGIHINQHVNAEAAWELATGKGITIAVLDDGVDQKHESFKGKIVHPRDTILNMDDANPKHPAEQHGTACAGVACASGKKEAAGVAPAAKLMPIRLGGIGSIAEAKAFKWAADHGADIISCSWGPMDGSWWNPNDPLHFSQARLPDSAKAAIDYAIEKGRDGKGCIITWAAGNGNENVKFDEYASYPRVIAVAACNDRGKRSVYSDFGDAVWCCFPSNDFHFPKLNSPRPLTAGIWTTDNQGNRGYNPGGSSSIEQVGDFKGDYTARFGGTSSACPGVAGVAALMLEKNPDLTWEEVREILKSSCDRIDPHMGNYDANGHSPFYGYGRVNALKAVENAIAAGQTKPSTLEATKVGGIVFSNKNGKVELVDDDPFGPTVKSERVLGVELNVLPFHPRLDIEYKVAVRNKKVYSGKNGSFAGVKDRRRSVVGISAKLTGELANNCRLVYEVKFSKGKKWTEATDGEWAGSSNVKKGKTIVGFRITLVK